MRPMIRRRTLACAIVFGFLVVVRADPTAVGAWPPNPDDDGLGAVHALFDLGAPEAGPFPSDWFTLRDRSHNTGRRVNLPLPDCMERVSDCEDLNVINTLDGFNLQPRLSIPFDRPIDVNTVTSETVFLIGLGSTLRRHNDDDNDDNGGDDDDDDDDEDNGLRVIGINQVVWDVATNTLHVESNDLLDQHTRYALLVTRGVRDASGKPVKATEAFRRFRRTVRGEYKQALLRAIHAARRLGIRESEIATASVFTTQSVTAVLEKIRDQIHAHTPEPANFLLGLNGERTVFDLDLVTSITWRSQRQVNPQVFNSVNFNLALVRDIFPSAVGRVAFGRYISPDYEAPGEYIPAVGTRTGTPPVQKLNNIFFNLFLPSGPKPADGWPVAIFGHGNTQEKNLQLPAVAASMAAHGIATIAINAVGHGFGPLGTLTVNQSVGGTVTFSAGGRGIDQDGNNMIGNNEGISSARPWSVAFFSDGIRQTTVDLMQLVRVIEVGMDLEGDRQHDLDPSRIYYFGQSLGANYGTILLAVEPSVRAGVSTAPGNPPANRQWGGRAPLGNLLNSRQPSLINPPGITVFGGRPISPPHFHENMPLRDGIPLTVQLADNTMQDIQSPVTNNVPGAMAIQEVIENTEWVSQAGSPVAYAPHLRKAPLLGVPAKSVIFQFAKGDESAPNPNTTAILRSGKLAKRTLYYRHDLARDEIPSLPKDPHMFMIGVVAFREISLGAQAQIAIFFGSDGETIIHPEPARLFEVPGPLPEELNYVP